MTTPNNTVAGLAEKLLPCPFCGRNCQYVEHLEGTALHPAYRVRCDYCGASTGYTDKDCRADWNRRASPAPSAPVVDDARLTVDVSKVSAKESLTLSRADFCNYLRYLAEQEMGSYNIIFNECSRRILSGVSAPVGVEAGPLAGKYGDLLRPFVAMMNRELHANAAKGERGWLQMDRKTVLLEIFYHVSKLMTAARDDDQDGIREYGADVANMAMMLVDVCDALPKAALTLPAAAPRVEGYITPSGERCRCDCHRDPNVKHVAPCCYPTATPAASEDGAESVAQHLIGIAYLMRRFPEGYGRMVADADLLDKAAALIRRLATTEQPGSAVQGGRELIRRLYVELLWCDRQLVDRGCKQGGSVRDVLADALEYLKSTPPPAPAAEQGDDSATDGWHAAVDAAQELYAKSPTHRHAHLSARVLRWIKSYRPTVATQPEARGVEEMRNALEEIATVAHSDQSDSDLETVLAWLASVVDPVLAAAPAAPGAAVGVDTKRLDWLEREVPDLRPVAYPIADTGDADVVWEVITYHMDYPKLRRIGSGETPRDAIDAAMAALAGKEGA